MLQGALEEMAVLKRGGPRARNEKNAPPGFFGWFF
jgi:hypothetical protein